MKKPKIIDLPTAFFGIVFAPVVSIVVIFFLVQLKLFISSEREAYQIGLITTLVITIIATLYAIFKNRFGLISLFTISIFNLSVAWHVLGDDKIVSLVIAVVSLLSTFAFAFKLQNHKRQPSDTKIFLFLLAVIICGNFVNFFVFRVLISH